MGTHRVGREIVIVLDFTVVFQSTANDFETGVMLRYVAAKVIVHGTQEYKSVLIVQFQLT
jgi:hypothetical protein